jgi:hypothetical protein
MKLTSEQAAFAPRGGCIGIRNEDPFPPYRSLSPGFPCKSAALTFTGR